ncbi:MAG: peptide chain release factor 2 [Acidimicrobiaceae bacterium]|nr:peptide chain release factor 2 [Acidimicrobiaceae bacterium]MEE2680679.1 peptide chain release factor 2 [Actinomycetota bacterium]MEE2807242.1 peptide chain release factor 2 [Actinomycetota bacterium]
MRDNSETLEELGRRVAEARTYLRIDQAREEMTQLESRAASPDLWNDQDEARKITSRLANVRDDIERWEKVNSEVDDATTLDSLAREEKDESLTEEIDIAISSISKELDDIELLALFNGEHDENDAVCEVHSGAGGTDACDWAEMVLRMYLRWAERKGFGVEIQEATDGGEAGISSATFIVKGRFAFGFLRAERGVHRLVRISPFDAQARRHTAFCSLSVVPFFDQVSDEVVIDEKDLRIDTYRSSGAGGQHVNVTDSAVRITHLPTGTVVACQNERSQHQNKDRAMQMLAAKLADLQRREREAELNVLAGEQREVAWGSQIRSYVLHPYQQVKDLRSNLELGNVDAVLDGELDPLMEAFLQWQRSQRDRDS